MSDKATVTVNVNALSNALAVAIQQATSSSPTTANSGSSGQTESGAGPIPQPCFSGSQQHVSARVVLPSYLKRKYSHDAKGSALSKRQKAVQSWDRDIVCIPPQPTQSAHLSYPRGKYRAHLGAHGLIGKIRLVSTMTVEDVENEVRCVFGKAMGGRKDFPFMFLQATGAGSRTLTVPSVSPSFSWTAQQVAKLGGNKQSIYILAQDKLADQFDSDISSGSDNEDPASSRPKHKVEERENQPHLSTHVPQLSERKRVNLVTRVDSDQAYKSYVDLIDLTGPDEHSSEEELPDVSITLAPARPRSNVPVKQDLIVAKHALQQHQHMVITSCDDEDYQRITIRRSHLFADASRAFCQSHFDVSKMLKVVFVGESSVDEGGPRREFFQLLMKDAFSASGLFVGWPENVIPVHNVEAIVANKYYTVGKMIATSLVQGGQPPVCFCDAVADYLVYDEVRGDPSLSDIPDVTVRQSLEKVQAVKSSDELRSIVHGELDVRFECGYLKPTIELSDKEQLVKAVWLHYVHFLPHAELEQLRKGLRETLQLETLVCLHPGVVHRFLVTSSDFEVSVPYLLDSFAIQYSEQGSNKRTPEEAIMLHWNDYVSECTERCVTLADILQFFSGSTKLPAAGFDMTPRICFTDETCLPRASTCNLSITFPRCFGQLTYEQFKEKMDMCVRDSFGFGQP